MSQLGFRILKFLIKLRLGFAVAFYASAKRIAPTRELRLVAAKELRMMTDLRWASRIFFGYPPDSPEFSRMFYKIDEFAMTDERWKPLVKQAARLMGIERE